MTYVLVIRQGVRVLMADFFYYVTAALSVGLVVSGILLRGGYCQIPFCVSCLMLGWVLPQFKSLLGEEFFPQEAIDAIAPMIFFVFLAMIVGWFAAPRRVHDVVTGAVAGVDDDRGRKAIIILSVIGLGLQLEIRRLAVDQVGEWTGPITILIALSSASLVALVVSFLRYLRLRNRIDLYLFIANLCLLVPVTVFSARRASSMSIFAIIVVGLWFQRRWQMPRLAVISGVVMAIVIANSIGNIRAVIFEKDASGKTITKDYSLADFANPELYTGAGKLYSNSEVEAQEIRNAAYIIAAVAEIGHYDYGASMWNAFVGAYVPGQIIGVEAKQALMVGQQGLDIAAGMFNYKAGGGTTSTGFSDSFQMFWYFGALIFGAIGWFMRGLYNKAEAGSIVHQSLYILLLSPTLESITHYSTYIFTYAPIVVAYLYILHRSAKRPSGSAYGLTERLSAQRGSASQSPQPRNHAARGVP
jgi:hypothetical protein